MRDFKTLFAGRDDVHGTYTIPAGTLPSIKGKLAGVATTKREAVTAEFYEAHLQGKKRLGIVPIRPGSNDVNWIAMDVDEYKTPDLHEKLAKKIVKQGLPLVLSLSKSGGAHMWCFFQKPIAAERARELGKTFLKKLGLNPSTEIFPKQDTIRAEDDGSWINLPYFGDTCHGLDETGKRKLTLEEFLEFVDDRVVDKDDIWKGSDPKPLEIDEEQDTSEDGGEAEGMPPCIARMLANGLEEGSRDQGLMQIGIYLIKAYPDDWEDRLTNINDEHVHPPMSMGEIGKTVKSLKGKSYQYMCKQSPMNGLCNKEACLKRKFGIGTGTAKEGPVVKVDQLDKIDGEEPKYRVTMYGKTFTVDAQTLFRYSAFHVSAMAATNQILPSLKNNDWLEMLSEKMATMNYIKVPEDTQMKSRIIARFKEWAMQSAMQTKPEIIAEHGIPYFDGVSLNFRGNDFMNMIDKQFRISRDEVWIYMRDWGVEQSFVTIEGKRVDTWRYPISKDDDWFTISKNGAF
jgi:hypothetical protein